MVINMTMNRYAKTIHRTLGAAALVIAALAIFILIVPRLINIEFIREMLVSTLSQKVGGELKFENIRLSILPQPHVEVIEGRLSVPDAFQARWKSLSMSARLLPLFIGKIDIGAVSVDRPDVSIAVPQKTVETDYRRDQSVSAIITEKTKPLAGLANAINKDLMITIRSGSLNFHVGNGSSLIFSGMDGRMDVTPDRIRISLNACTDFFETIEWRSDTDLKTFSSRGRIDLNRFRLQNLPPNLFGTETPWVGDSLINLGIDFKTEGFSRIEAQAQGSIPQFTVLRMGNPLALPVTSFKARFLKDSGQIGVFLTEAVLEHPKLSLSGKFLQDHETGRQEMELKAADLDVPATRQAVLALGGETAVVKAICHIIRGGRAPLLSIASRGNSFEELARPENMTLYAGLSRGIIAVPGVGLTYEDVSANINIQNSILTAEKIKGRYDNSTVFDGSLLLGLSEIGTPFRLDIGLNVDLAEVPPILKKVIKDERVLKEVDRIAVVGGRAEGRLILGESLGNIAATVKVSEFTLAARVASISTTLTLKGNDFAYSGTAVRVGRLEGRLKNSGFMVGPVQLDWQKTLLIDIQAGSAELRLNEIYVTLSAFDSLKNTLKSVEFISGAASLSSLRMTGPLAVPTDWNFRVKGRGQDIQVKSDLLPDALSVHTVAFEATPRMLSILRAQTVMLDSALTVSARLTGTIGAVQAADLQIEGNVNAEGNQWLWQKIEMPAHLIIQAPLRISNGRLEWQRSGLTAFSGDLALQNDLNVSADVLLRFEVIHIKKFTVQDKDSNAAFSLNLRKGREIDFGFKGNLLKTTVDKLLVENRVLKGRVRGDLRFAYAIGRPLDTQFEGTLSAENMNFTKRLGIPLKVKNLTVTGFNDNFDIAADILFQQDQELKLKGWVDHSHQGVLVYSELTADKILLGGLIQELAKNDKKEKADAKDTFWEFPVQGVVKIDSAHVTYGRYTWNSVSSTIILKPEEIVVHVGSAELCGISTPGTLMLTPREIQLKFDTIARDRKLGDSSLCLVGQESKIEGRYHLTGLLKGQGTQTDLMRSLAGSAELNVGDGRFYAGSAYRVLREILVVLNFTEIYRGKLPDITKEGFGFRSIKAKIKTENDAVFIEEGIIDGLNMELAVNGVVGLSDKKINLTLLVAPLKTVDSIIKRIPLVGDILGGTLISVPVAVSGNLNEPKVTILPPAAVGEGLLRIMMRTLQLPVKIIDPFFKQ